MAVNLRFARWINIVAFVLMVLVNGIAGSTTLLGGRNTAQISDNNPTLITPAGYVFSIWGIIYVLLGVFLVFQALPSENGKEYQRKIGSLFVLSCLLNITWLFLWQYELLSLSVVLMFLLLSTLNAIYLRLDVGRSKVPLREKLVIHIPFSVYLGWITIASIANVAVTLVSTNWSGLGIVHETWAGLVLVIALLIASLVVGTRRDLAYGLVIIWAFLGIAVKQGRYPNVVMTAEICAVATAIVEGVTILRIRLRPS